MKNSSLFLIALGIIFICSIPSYVYAEGGHQSNALAAAFIYGYKNANSAKWIYFVHGNRMKKPVKNLTKKILSKCTSKFTGSPALIKECIEGAQTRLHMEYLYIYVNSGA